MTETKTSGDVRADSKGRRPWWRTVPFIVGVGVLPVAFGFYFVGLIAIALLLSDPDREDEIRAGASVLVLWWMYMFRQGDTSPWFSGTLLAIGVVFYARSAWKRSRAARRGGAAVSAGVAAGAVALVVIGFVPWGLRTPELSRTDALARTLAERRERPWRAIEADVYLVERGRLRFVHKPVYFVVLYERHPDIDRTADNQPCLRHREVWRVDALDGSVARETYDDADVAGDPCLPLRIGTESDLKPVPS